MDLDWSAILGGRHEAPPLQSGVLTGRLRGFTFDRLYRCLHALDVDIEISFILNRSKSAQTITS